MDRCQHCKERPVSRHSSAAVRDLCHRCAFTPEIRAQYPSSGGKFAYRGVGGICGGYQAPREATEALPGTFEKVAVLEARAQAGTSLWHEEDAVRS